MIEMIAKRRMPYNRRDLHAGEAFAAYPRDARVLALLGAAEYATKEERAVVEELVAGVDPYADEPAAPKKRRRRKKAAAQADE